MWWFFFFEALYVISPKMQSLVKVPHWQLTLYLPFLETLFFTRSNLNSQQTKLMQKRVSLLLVDLTFNTVLYALTGRAKVDNLQFSIWQKLLRMWKMDTLTLNYFRGKVIIFWATISKIAAIVRVNSWIAFDQIQTQTWNE